MIECLVALVVGYAMALGSVLVGVYLVSGKKKEDVLDGDAFTVEGMDDMSPFPESDPQAKVLENTEKFLKSFGG